jgi:hypothetical protein
MTANPRVMALQLLRPDDLDDSNGNSSSAPNILSTVAAFYRREMSKMPLILSLADFSIWSVLELKVHVQVAASSDVSVKSNCSRRC